jgi:hypothetical protein
MASTITTTGTDNDPLSTDRNHGESVEAWVERHGEEVTASTPSGDTLTTTWTSSAGPQSKRTTRVPGESNAAFKLRHVLEYTTAMVEHPPI